MVWVKYFPAPASYNVGAQTLFRDFPDCNYLCLIPDDVVINQAAWDKLIEAAKTGKYDVISGVCNQKCDSDYAINQSNITMDIIPDWAVLDPETIDSLWVKIDELPQSDEPIKVAFSGFPVMFVKKEVLERVGEFTADDQGFNRDVQFCKKLKKAGINIYCVPTAQFLHLKHHPDPELSASNILTGKKYPQVVFTRPNRLDRVVFPFPKTK
jgi:GT2 family glycosyltransferase